MCEAACSNAELMTLVSVTCYFKGILKVEGRWSLHCVKAETVHKDSQSGLVKVRTDRFFLEMCLKQSFEAGGCGTPK